MSMTREELVAAVDRLYAASGTGDWDQIAELVTDDFVAIEAECLPMAGVYRGIEGYRELFSRVMGMVDVVGLDRSDLLLGEDCAIALVSMRFADPELEPAQICEMFRFRDGKLCEIKPYYFDPSPFIAAVEAKAAVKAPG